MDHFVRRQGELFAEDVALRDVAMRFGTPTYVYSRATLTRHVQVLREAFASQPHTLCYAVKANGAQGLLQIFSELGLSFDAVSVGELARVTLLGLEPHRVILSGVGKRDDEIARALSAGVLYIAVESEPELLAVGRIAAHLGKRAAVAIRVNPDVDAKTHPYIATGLRENKFGVPVTQAIELYRRGLSIPTLALVGVTCHIGSQITDLAPFRDAARLMAQLATQLVTLGVPLQYVGMGGGLGIPYGDELPPTPAAYGRVLVEELAALKLTLILEPGRVLVGNAGVLLTQVVRTKKGTDRNFVVVDAGMNDLLRPALYEAHHAIEPVGAPRGPAEPVDIVGPVCESADVFGKARDLAPLLPGDLLAIRSAGAYGFVMSSTYNGRPRAAEVLIDGASMCLLRQRESLSDLWRGEHWLDGTPVPHQIPEVLRGGRNA